MMKIFSILVSVFLSVAVNAQTDSLQKAKDYIKQRELTDPNMNGAKRSRLKKTDSAHPVVVQESNTVQHGKKKYKP